MGKAARKFVIGQMSWEAALKPLPQIAGFARRGPAIARGRRNVA